MYLRRASGNTGGVTRMTKSEERVVKAAIALWKQNKPLNCSLQKYIKNPEVNNFNMLQLAKAVADYLKSNKND